MSGKSGIQRPCGSWLRCGLFPAFISGVIAANLAQLEGAIVFMDDFDRPDSTEIGNGWIQSGTAPFIIADNHLEIGDSGAGVLSRAHEGGVGSANITVTWTYRRHTLLAEYDGVSIRHNSGARTTTEGLVLLVIPLTGAIRVSDADEAVSATVFFPMDVDVDYSFQWDVRADHSMQVRVWPKGGAPPVVPLLEVPAFTPRAQGTHWALGNRIGLEFDDFVVQTPTLARSCPEGEDSDEDLICSDADNCPSVANPDQLDTDLDLAGDVCDDDDDNDGIPDLTDNCPKLSNPLQVDTNGNGVGDECDDDHDSDGIPDGEDNCSAIFNPDQSDSDADGMGDLCDEDADNDNVSNALDNCPLVANSGQEDRDGDGVGDACEVGRLALSAPPQSSICEPITVHVLLTNDCNVEAVSFGITHPRELVRATAFQATPLWNGSLPEFVAVSLDAAGDGAACGASDRGVTVAMVGNPADPRSRTMGPGVAQTMASLVYEVTTAGPQVALEFSDCLVPTPGSPPTTISVTCDGDTIRPARLEGAGVVLTAASCRKRGLCNDDGIYDISDPVFLLSYLFSGGRAPGCLDPCDCRNDGSIDISDGICFLNHLFLAGLPPTPSFALCE